MTKKECVLCAERKHEISRILAAYKKDKKYYRYAIIAEAVLILFLAAFGRKGIIMLFNFVKEIF
jgi:hypothetical protein